MFLVFVDNFLCYGFGYNDIYFTFATLFFFINMHTFGRKYPQTIIYIIIGIGLVLMLGLLFFLKNVNLEKVPSRYSGCNQVLNATVPILPASVLNDKNDLHLLHAQTNGLKQPFDSNGVFERRMPEMLEKHILAEVKENQYYKLKKLTHSHPYLIPECIEMLNEIGARFQARLKEKKYPHYRFRITSLLRTEETQNKLSKRNGNATGHSAHLYGTTVDISYKNFFNVQKDTLESSYEAVQTLTKVLVEMREECKFLAVRERKQSCFHLTIVLCKPLTNSNE